MNTRCFCCGLPLKEGEKQYHRRCAKALFGSTHVPLLHYTQEELNALAQKTLLERISVPGVQPKLSLHLERGSPTTANRLTLVGLEGDYILKPQTPQWAHLPEAEHFCMRLAQKCKLSTVAFGLIPLASGELAYITKRMDRMPDGPRHMEDFCQILNKTTAQKYHGSMEQIGKALRLYSDTPGLDVLRLFELAIFSFLTGNSDMHLKNFSLLQFADRHYELSPAYDLVPVKLLLPEDHEELALTLCGKKNNLKRNDFERFGATLRLNEKQIQQTFTRLFKSLRHHLTDTLATSFLPEAMKTQMRRLIEARLLHIE